MQAQTYFSFTLDIKPTNIPNYQDFFDRRVLVKPLTYAQALDNSIDSRLDFTWDFTEKCQIDVIFDEYLAASDFYMYKVYITTSKVSGVVVAHMRIRGKDLYERGEEYIQHQLKTLFKI